MLNVKVGQVWSLQSENFRKYTVTSVSNQVVDFVHASGRRACAKLQDGRLMNANWTLVKDA